MFGCEWGRGSEVIIQMIEDYYVRRKLKNRLKRIQQNVFVTNKLIKVCIL